MTDIDLTRLAEVPRELLEAFVRSVPLDELSEALIAALAPPKLRTRAEVDAEIVALVRKWRTQPDPLSMAQWLSIYCGAFDRLASEPTREPDPAPPAASSRGMTEAEEALLHWVQEPAPSAQAVPATDDECDKCERPNPGGGECPGCYHVPDPPPAQPRETGGEVERLRYHIERALGRLRCIVSKGRFVDEAIEDLGEALR